MSNKPNSAALNLYTDALNMVWPTSARIRDYCMSKLDEIIVLDNGMFFVLEKQKIEKDFCFGYSLSFYDSESYDNANKMVNHASTDENYFIRQNMKYYDGLLERLSEDRYSMPVLQDHYMECHTLKSLCFLRTSCIIDDQGGSACLGDLKGTVAYRNQDKNHPYYILSDRDIEVTKSAILRCRERHEKKVRAYLKRYGLTKVNAWSYWRDA